MDHICKIGESSLSELENIRETLPPVCIVVYCLEGSAELTILSNSFPFIKGCGTIITTDMLPSVTNRSDDFRAFYMMFDRDFTDNATYNVPTAFFDAIYIEPVLRIDDFALPWIGLIKSVAGADSGYRDEVLSSLLRGFILDYFSRWEIVYGKGAWERERKSADMICSKFYNLVMDNFREHHDTTYYADKLHITANYLAMLIRKICLESPKEAIDRQLVLEIKHLLRTTSLSIEQISHKLNFNNASYMCRFFRKRTGRSLSEFRNQQM